MTTVALPLFWLLVVAVTVTVRCGSSRGVRTISTSSAMPLLFVKTGCPRLVRKSIPSLGGGAAVGLGEGLPDGVGVGAGTAPWDSEKNTGTFGTGLPFTSKTKARIVAVRGSPVTRGGKAVTCTVAG